MIQTISRAALKSLMDAGSPLTLVEALPEKYYQAEHLPGAIHLPHDELGAKAEALIPDRTAAVVVYCANAQCQNSHIAAQILKRMGYTQVYQYVGGKADWKEAGFPMEGQAALV